MDSPERIWQLIAKSLNKEIPPPEMDELCDSLRGNTELQQQYELLTRIWNEKQDHITDEEDARKHILKIISRAETEDGDAEVFTRRKRRRRRLFAGMTAAALFILLVSGWLLSHSSATSADAEVLITKNGSRTRSLLPDGTTVWLNAGSKLLIETDFAGATREVRLEGEAFFDVVKNPQRPFIVHTSGIDIKVLGTAFNVKAYPEDKNVETTLLRGLIQVFDTKDKTGKPIELRPNEKLVLPANTAGYSVESSEGNKLPVVKELPRFSITKIDSSKKENERIETAWVYSRLEFRGDSFEELAQKLQRWYNITIVFADEKVKQLSFNGSFEKETVEQAFEALKAANANSFVYKINNHEISVGSSE